MSTSTNSYNEFRSSAFLHIVLVLSHWKNCVNRVNDTLCRVSIAFWYVSSTHHPASPAQLSLLSTYTHPNYTDLLYVGFWYFLCLVVMILKHRKCSLFFCQRNSFSFSSSFWIKPNLTATVTAITRPIFGLLWSEGVSFSKWSILTKERGMGHYPSIALWKFWNLFFLWNIVLW